MKNVETFKVAVDMNPYATAKREATNRVLPWITKFIATNDFDFDAWQHGITFSLTVNAKFDEPLDQISALADVLRQLQEVTDQITVSAWHLTSGEPTVEFDAGLGTIEGSHYRGSSAAVSILLRPSVRVTDLVNAADNGDHNAQFLMTALGASLFKQFGAEDGATRYAAVRQAAKDALAALTQEESNV